MAETQDIWALLEQDDPKARAVQSLYSWSLNYDAGKGPFALFLDLIGWSEEEFGDTIWQGKPSSGLGYVELSKLADALQEYATRPQYITEYVGALMAAESAE